MDVEKRVPRIAAVISLTILGVAGFWLNRESSRGCQVARALVREAANLRLAEAEAARDPFLELLNDRRTADTRANFERELGRGLGELWLWPRVSEPARILLRGFARLGPGPESWTRARDAAAALGPDELVCGGAERDVASLGANAGADQRPAVAVIVAAGLREPRLLERYVRSLHEEDMRFLAEEGPRHAKELATQWESDRAIYCHSLLSLTRLLEIDSRQEQACKSQPAKYTLGCRPGADARLRGEIEQLTQVKSINERKLRTKWGPKLYPRLRCDGGAA